MRALLAPWRVLRRVLLRWGGLCSWRSCPGSCRRGRLGHAPRPAPCHAGQPGCRSAIAAGRGTAPAGWPFPDCVNDPCRTAWPAPVISISGSSTPAGVWRAVASPKDHRSADMTGERRCATSAFSADQLWKPYSRANASCAADSVTRGETAPSRPAACGSPSAGRGAALAPDGEAGQDQVGREART